MAKKNNLKLLIYWSILILICISIIYYNKYYCKKIYYKSTCKHCIKWVEKNNDMTGKYRRTWEECAKYEYYDCVYSEDSCGCNKIK